MTARPSGRRTIDTGRAGPNGTPAAFEVQATKVIDAEDARSLGALLRPRSWDDLDQQASGTVRRRVAVQRLPASEFGDLADHLREVMLAINDVRYRFELSGHRRSDAPHAVRYVPGRGHYDWHVDAGAEWATRKLSLVVFLSEPDDYEGGVLEIAGAGNVARPEPGSGVVLPSFLAHRVTPVTAGERITVVAWMHGPTFR
jgi:PKHD-type hydroxylase